jgi:hypothetical protein
MMVVSYSSVAVPWPMSLSTTRLVLRPVEVADIPAISRLWTVLATSLYDNPAAELHEDASAGLGEHLALADGLILRRSSPGVRA